MKLCCDFERLVINTSYQKLPFGSGDDPDKLFFFERLVTTVGCLTTEPPL